jgi:hypothetical protein
MLESYKTSYYRDKINQADRNKLFRLVNGLFQKNSKALPSYTSLELLVEELTTSLSIKFEILEMNWNCTKKTLKYLPKYELDKLQRVQNAASRLITGKKKSDHITPVLKELHWLPIKYRTHFKIILLVYKSLHNLAPNYLHKIIEETSILPMFTAFHSKYIHHDIWKACFFSCCPGTLELFSRIHEIR